MPLFIFALNRLIYRASEFIEHWYIDSFFRASHALRRTLEELDGFFAVRAFWRRIFLKPAKLGVWGVFSGFLRIILGGAIYIFLAGLAVAIFLAWALVPPFLILKAAGFDFTDFTY